MIFHQFCEVGALAIIHKRNEGNLATSFRQKSKKNLGTWFFFGGGRRHRNVLAKYDDLRFFFLAKYGDFGAFFPKKVLYP